MPGKKTWLGKTQQKPNLQKWDIGHTHNREKNGRRNVARWKIHNIDGDKRG